MHVKQISYDMDQMRQQKAGLDKMADAVKVTLGPKGRTVTIQKYAKAKVTKDGVSVAREISLLNQFEDMGAQLALETCMKSNDVAGDGTTTAIVLAQAIMKEGMEKVESGINPIDIKRGIEMGTKQALIHLFSMARDVESDEQLLQVGTISSNGDEQISEVIVEAINKSGKNGMITYQESSNLKTSLNMVSGYHFKEGYHEEAYCNNPEKLECVLRDTFVLLTSITFNNWGSLFPYVYIANELNKPLLIIAEDIEGQAKSNLLKVVYNAGSNVCVVRAPLSGPERDQLMMDIAKYTGGQYLRDDMGERLIFDHKDPEAVKVALQKFGHAHKVVVGKNTTAILGGNSHADFEDYCKTLYGAQESEEDPARKGFIQERLARLTSGVAEILVGGTTRSETMERKDRVEDAINACKAAKEEGILPGGGVALLRVSNMSFEKLVPVNDGERAGIEIVKKALRVPIHQLVINAGVDPDQILAKISQSSDVDFGWDVSRNVMGNMYAMGIVDPLKVVRSALEGAASIAGLMLGNGCTIVDHVTMQDSGRLSPLINI